MTTLAKRPKPQPLTKQERRELRTDEETIDRHKPGFTAVGYALINIREKRLYRTKYSTFDEYCGKRWGFGRDYASKVITATVMARGVYTMVDNARISPTLERQVRPLKALQTPERKEAWEKAVRNAGGRQPTESQVREAVAMLQPAKVCTIVHSPELAAHVPGDMFFTIRKALEILRSITQPTKNISAAIVLLERETDGGAENSKTVSLNQVRTKTP